jgi:regulatory protein
MPLRSLPKLSSVDAGDPSAARLAAVALLARRDYCGSEMARKLTDRGFTPVTAQAVVGELVASGLLSESRYVEGYVRSHAARGQGPSRIGADLRRNGVPEALIEQGLDSVDWVELARRVRRSRFGAEVPQDWAEKARQARFLQYRGFSADHIRSATGADPDLD